MYLVYISIIYCTCKLKILYIGPINVMFSYYLYKNCCTFFPTLYNHSWYFVLSVSISVLGFSEHCIQNDFSWTFSQVHRFRTRELLTSIIRNLVNYGVLVYETLFRAFTLTLFKIIYISIIYCTCKLKILYIGPINVMFSYFRKIWYHSGSDTCIWIFFPDIYYLFT
jgi:hypothetical protein